MYKYSTYRLKDHHDPLESVIKDMINRKKIWWLLVIIFLLFFVVLFLSMIIYYSTIRKGQVAGLYDPLVVIWFVVTLLLSIAVMFYADNNLNKKQYYDLSKYLNIKTDSSQQNIHYGLYTIQPIKIAAYIEPFFFTYFFGPMLGYVNPGTIKKITIPDYMNRTGQVNLFYLYSSPYKVDFELKVDSLMKPDIETDCPEINSVISEFIKNLDYCHWRIIFNDHGLQLVIIGGSWQGEIFARNIENGLDMFKELVRNMKGKYPVKDWQDYAVQWHEESWGFSLKKTEA